MWRCVKCEAEIEDKYLHCWQCPSTEVQREGFYRAGIRCAKLLAERQTTKNIPVILYTILAYADLKDQLNELPARVIHVRKESDDDRLIEVIQELRRH